MQVTKELEYHKSKSWKNGTLKKRHCYASFDKYPVYLDMRQQMVEAKALTSKPLYQEPAEGIASNTIFTDHKTFINFSSYNYLGLVGDDRVNKAAVEAIYGNGTSVSASRIASGERPLHRELEESLADFLKVEDALVYTAGFMTNASTISYLMGENDLVIIDSLAHNSIVFGATSAQADLRIFPHNNTHYLKQLLERHRDDYERVLIVIEGVYSVDGDIPDLPKFIELKKQYDCFLMVDEAHSIGTIGKTGHGISEYYNVNSKDVDIWMGTLSKTLASCGGYIAGAESLIQLLRYFSPGFVYSCGLSPPNTAAALAALEITKIEPERVQQLQKNAKFMSDLLIEGGVNIGLSKDSPVIPVVIGDKVTAWKFNIELRTYNIYTHVISYPVVKKNKARIRLFINNQHTEEQLIYTAKCILELYKKYVIS